MRFKNSLLITKNSQQGFTLIEIIIGMTVLSISLAIILNLIVPTEQQSADQIHQIKAAELGQSMLEEILGRAFDNNSDMTGSIWRCSETIPVIRTACTDEVDFGPEPGEANNRNLFDDVDDYHGYQELKNSTNDPLDNGYNNFKIDVSVTYDGIAIGLASNLLAKRVTVTIITPLGMRIEFSGYKSNF